MLATNHQVFDIAFSKEPIQAMTFVIICTYSGLYNTFTLWS